MTVMNVHFETGT